jgi:HEAT repeat protein
MSAFIPWTPEDPTVGTLLANIKHGDASARAAAIRQATLVGTSAILPLAQVFGDDNRGAGKAAGEALKRIVHHAARPGAEREAKAAAESLIKLIDRVQPRKVRVTAIYLLGYIGKGDAVPPLAALLAEEDIREEARMALERIPDRAAEGALRRALRSVSADFRPNIEQSLRHRRMTFKTVGTQRSW